ncbi:MAG: glycosyltransferase family 39 protein [Eubacterium coprostanoligenes]|uniref:ArnT family glycosyltransferase n=1 Tax=Eubacterium coprostanoligenes TaxID=290054 RepID=UPI00240956AD|nr:glycosyltransferase family 39 protein [Eubacterium coprostanoligenes]MDD6665185.1 glycosyltransferase family 39 protein [Eubacterium coprostanoligenes]
MNINKWYKSKDKFLFWLVVIGIVLRIIFFLSNLIIGGVHIDESMIFANALSIVNNGTDLLGNKFPVYFPTWFIGGQSPLGTYLSAFAVKLFGNSLFVLRLPALIVGCIGLVCSAKLGDLLFSKKEFKYAFVGLSAVSPWMIFSSCYVLDCNYMGYNLIFGILMLAKGLKQNKRIYYAISMLLFSLCFYSYIASVLVIPVFLAITYLILFVRKKISIGDCLLSVVLLLLFSIPFIIFGLVLIGKIEPFSTQIMSFPDMKFYSRENSLALNSGTVFEVIKQLFKNFFEALSIIAIPESTVTLNDSNLFLYGNLGAGFISLFGLIDNLLLKLHKKEINCNTITKSIIIASGGAIVVFCSMTNAPLIVYAYRYGVLTPLLLLFEAIGLTQLVNKIKNIDIKKSKLIIVGYLAVSLIFFGTEFFYMYSNNIKSDSLTYGDSLKICLNESDKINPNDTTIICNAQCDQATLVYLYYYRQNKNLNDFADCMLDSYTKSDKVGYGYSLNDAFKDEIISYGNLHLENKTNNKISVSDTITILNSDEIELTEKCYIVQHSELSQYNYENYKVKENGFYDILIKK